MKINLGSSRKRYQHDMSYHVDTTSDFGFVQPILCQFLNSGDSIDMKSFRQLVRNGVMPSPTFGSIQCANTFRFVSMAEIFPAYDAMLSGQYIQTDSSPYIPGSVPLISSKLLVFILCSSRFSKLSLFRVLEPTPAGIVRYSRNMVTLTTELSQFFCFASNDFASYYDVWKSLVTSGGSFLNFTSDGSIDSGDFVLRGTDKKEGDLLLSVSLTNRGRRLYKVLKSLGYSLDPDDGDLVSMLPILAYYKAWFDTYSPQRTVNWHSTNAYSFVINQYISGFTNLLMPSGNGTRLCVDFVNLLVDLADDCYYSYSPDYYSVQTSKVLNITDTSVSKIESVASDGISRVPTVSDVLPYIPAGQNVNKLKLDVLSRVTRFLTKNSVIGGKVYDYIRVHYGAGVADDMFAQSGHIATLITDVTIDDFYSSSDTFNSDSKDGRFLGSRSGVGQGFSKSGFNYKAQNFGFVVGLCAIYPQSFYFQGNDPQLFMKNRYDFPSSDFDCLGYELTPLSTIYDKLGLSLTSSSDDVLTNRGFGFMPRYSMYKYKKNILSGDMAMRSTMDSFKGFHLDRMVVPFEINADPLDSSDITSSAIISFPESSVPLASEAWRFVLRYPYLSNPDRIFLNSGFVSDFANTDYIHLQKDDIFLDNFTVQCNCQMYVYNQLKPLSHSFDTFDVNDTTSSEVTPS